MPDATFLNSADFKQWLKLALTEDVGSGDITSQLLLPEKIHAKLEFRSRAAMVVSGLPLISAVLNLLTDDYKLTLHTADGESFTSPALLATVIGDAQSLLTAERLALNLLQRCSGVASLTAQYVGAVRGTKAQILDTRKTMPAMRQLDKYAVRCGGGTNHRMRLDDRILIKDNHIAICGGIAAAIEKAIAGNHHKLLIEVECDTLSQMEVALQYPIDWIMLDNMSLAEMAEAVKKRGNHKAKLEASGGITLQTVRAVAETGVDAISAGALTHSAIAADIGLDIEFI